MDDKGFTIIELIVSLAILAIISVVILASVEPSDRAALQNAKTILMDDVRFMQDMARLKGTHYYMQFNAAEENSHIYRIFRRENDGRRDCPINPSTDLGEGIVIRTSPRHHNGRIGFTPYGTATVAATIVIEKGNYNVALTLNLGSGRIASNAGIQRIN